MSFAAPVCLLGAAARAAGAAAPTRASRRRAQPLRGALHRPCRRSRSPPARSPAWRRHLPAALRARRARRARAGAGQAAEDGRGAGRARVGHARDRPLGLDVGRPTSSPTAWPPRSAPRSTFLDQLPDERARRRRRLLRRARRGAARRRADHDDARRDRRRARSPTARTATGDALEVAHRRAQERQAERQAPAGGDRPALRRQDDDRPRPGRGRAQRAGQLKIPIYTVALGTARRDVPNPDPFGRRCSVAARPRDAAPDRRRSPAARRSRPRTPTRSTSIYKTLGSQLGTKTAEARDHARASRSAGSCCCSAPAVASLRWAGRLP